MEQAHFLLWMSFTHFSEIAYWDHMPQNIQTYQKQFRWTLNNELLYPSKSLIFYSCLDNLQKHFVLSKHRLNVSREKVVAFELRNLHPCIPILVLKMFSYLSYDSEMESVLIAIKQQYVVAYSWTKKIVLLSAETTSLLLSATKQIHQRK